MTSITFSGGQELDRRLTRLDMRIQQKYAGSATRKGAAHLRKVIKKRLPSGPSKPKRLIKGKLKEIHLKNSVGIIKIKRWETTYGGFGKSVRQRTTGYRVGYKGLARIYGHLLEYGTYKQAPNRIWTNSFENEAQSILDIMASELRKAIDSA